ncbi:MAG: DUF4249 domain-containing protein [Bacteroidetes bacterium]|nr:DUF4249 domain-containing protein [Bacteroidota bacterium]
MFLGGFRIKKFPFPTRLVSLIFIVISGFFGCIQEIELELGKVSSLVINGEISNEPGPYKVKLSYSTGFNENSLFVPIDPRVLKAEVKIVDDLGNEEVLNEIGDGKYITTIGGIQGTIGRTYMLMITLNNGEKYESLPERLKSPVPIDNVGFEFASEAILSNSGENLSSESRLKFNVSFTDPPEGKNYYRWRYEEVYEVIAPLADSLMATFQFFPPDCLFCPPPIIKRCWGKDFDNEYLYVESDLFFNGRSVTALEILSMPITRKLLIKYSVLVKQYSISEGAYNYWNNLKGQISNTGTIFETPNFQILGNIRSTSNSDEAVLGYFGVNSVSEKRIFIDNQEVPYAIVGLACPPLDGTPPGALCTNCTAGGASQFIPSFWPE